MRREPDEQSSAGSWKSTEVFQECKQNALSYV